jgi:hypothetical protein
MLEQDAIEGSRDADDDAFEIAGPEAMDRADEGEDEEATGPSIEPDHAPLAPTQEAASRNRRKFGCARPPAEVRVGGPRCNQCRQMQGTALQLGRNQVKKTWAWSKFQKGQSKRLPHLCCRHVDASQVGSWACSLLPKMLRIGQSQLEQSQMNLATHGSFDFRRTQISGHAGCAM